MTSSRIWNASPSGSPKRLSCGQQRVGTIGRSQQRADVQRPLDRVLAALVTGDALGLVEPALATHRAEDVEELTDVELGAQLVPHPPHGVRGADEQLVGEHERQVADEDRGAFAEAA